MAAKPELRHLPPVRAGERNRFDFRNRQGGGCMFASGYTAGRTGRLTQAGGNTPAAGSHTFSTELLVRQPNEPARGLKPKGPATPLRRVFLATGRPPFRTDSPQGALVGVLLMAEAPASDEASARKNRQDAPVQASGYAPEDHSPVLPAEVFAADHSGGRAPKRMTSRPVRRTAGSAPAA